MKNSNNLTTERLAVVWCAGKPIPQGSMSAFIRGTRAVVVDQKKKQLEQWRAEIRSHFQANMTPARGPVTVWVTFFLRRPACQMTKTGRKTTKFREYPAVKPDVDKLARAVLDALSGVAYGDDAQVVSVTARKLYCRIDAPEGALISVERVVK